MTPEELRERTMVWFVEDDQDQPEIPYEPHEGRNAALVDYLHALGGKFRLDARFWDPVRKVDARLYSVPNPGAEYDAGRADSFVAELHGIRFDGVELPPICVFVGLGYLFWDCGPAWDSAEVVAAFFDLLGALERDCGVTLAFGDEDQTVEVGPSFAAIYREWHGR